MGMKVLAGRSNSKEPKVQEPSQGQLAAVDKPVQPEALLNKP